MRKEADSLKGRAAAWPLSTGGFCPAQDLPENLITCYLYDIIMLGSATVTSVCQHRSCEDREKKKLGKKKFNKTHIMISLFAVLFSSGHGAVPAPSPEQG